MSDDEMAKFLEWQGELQNAIDATGAWEIKRKLEVAAEALRLPPWNADVTKLSGGERNRVHLAKLLRSGGNVILLDEPKLDIDTLIRALEEAILAFPSCIMVISHGIGGF